MVQRIEEQDGYMLLHYGEPPADVGQIEFVNCIAHQQNRILFCKWRDENIWVVPGGRVEPGETAEEDCTPRTSGGDGGNAEKSRSSLLHSLFYVQS